MLARELDMKNALLATIVATGLAAASLTAHADDGDDGFGLAGVLSNKNSEDLPEATLSSGIPLLDVDKLVLQSGKYYEWEITSDGSQELALAGAGFLHAIWIDEIVIQGIEIRPLGLDSLEFDEAGTVEISFLAIKPGTYTFGVPDRPTQTLEIIIE